LGDSTEPLRDWVIHHNAFVRGHTQVAMDWITYYEWFSQIPLQTSHAVLQCYASFGK
jgi:hypothetical protein